MNSGRVIISPCVNVATLPDERCLDDAFALANPGLCPGGLTPRLVISPGFALACALGSVQFHAIYRANGTEVDVTASTIFSSSDDNIAVVGAISGNATGLAAGIAEISGSYTPPGATTALIAMAEFNIIGTGDNCCSSEPVSMMVVVDNSRSMGQAFSSTYSTRLAFAKAAATRFISEVNPVKDQVGLMRFNEADNVVLSPLSHSVAAVAALIPSIPQTQQSTAFFDALTTAIAQLDGVTGLKVIVLISDGEDQSGTYTDANNPIALLSDFKAAGGVVLCMGCRASGRGYSFLSLLATGGFFLNGYGASQAAALDYLSGLKGYICAGNCVPKGDDIENKGALNYAGFINFDLVDGTTVDLQGNGFFDFLPGNGLYVDLAGTNPDRNGHMVTKVGIPVDKDATYRISVVLSGNQRQNFSPNSALIRVFYLSGTTEVDLLSQAVVVTDYTMPFTTFAYTFVSPVAENVFLSVQQQAVPADQDERIGLMLGEVKFELLSAAGEAMLVGGGTTLFDDNFDDENPVYVPPRCGPGSGGYGYFCYGYGCLDEPPVEQLPDPSPLPDIEAGFPPPHEYTSTKQACATCPAGTGNGDTTDLVPAMTGVSTPSGTVIFSADSEDHGAWTVFDNSPVTYWVAAGVTSGYVGYHFPAAVVVNGYSITATNSAIGSPTNWTFEGSQDGVTWTVLGTQTGQSFYGAEVKSFTVTNTTAYLYYRLNISATNGVGTQNLNIVEVEFFGGAAPAQVCKTATATSEISQTDADNKARDAALALATAELDCRPFFTSTQQVQSICPHNTFGGPFTASATRTSHNSQAEADFDATAAATAAANALRDADCSGSNNTQRIVINDRSGALPAPATPYPSVKHVEVADGIVIAKVTVTLTGFKHVSPDDVCILLESPSGQKVLLMVHCGGTNAVNTGITLIFDDDAASGMLPDSTQLVAGTFAPSQYGTLPTTGFFPAPAPDDPYFTTLDQFIGENSAGSWALWIVDDTSIAAGEITSGWTLTFS